MNNNTAGTEKTRYGKAIFYFSIFVLANTLITALFFILWMQEYRMGPSVAGLIDRILVPWGWLAIYSAVNFIFLRRVILLLPAILISIVLAIVLSMYLIVGLIAKFDPAF